VMGSTLAIGKPRRSLALQFSELLT